MPQLQHFTGSLWEIQDTALAGEAVVVLFPSSGPATVALYPAAGFTAHVEFSTSGQAAVRAGTARWNDARGFGTGGVVNAASTADIPSPLTAIRVTAIGGACGVEVLQ